MTAPTDPFINWLFQQSPIVIVLIVIVVVLWRAYQKSQNDDQATEAWRAEVRQRINEIEQKLGIAAGPTQPK